jgi:hypothetical protein
MASMAMGPAQGNDIWDVASGGGVGGLRLVSRLHKKYGGQLWAGLGMHPSGTGRPDLHQENPALIPSSV